MLQQLRWANKIKIKHYKDVALNTICQFFAQTWVGASALVCLRGWIFEINK